VLLALALALTLVADHSLLAVLPSWQAGGPNDSQSPSDPKPDKCHAAVNIPTQP
jgi:hypothetical protein